MNLSIKKTGRFLIKILGEGCISLIVALRRYLRKITPLKKPSLMFTWTLRKEY